MQFNGQYINQQYSYNPECPIYREIYNAMMKEQRYILDKADFISSGTVWKHHSYLYNIYACSIADAEMFLLSCC